MICKRQHLKRLRSAMQGQAEGSVWILFAGDLQWGCRRVPDNLKDWHWLQWWRTHKLVLSAQQLHHPGAKTLLQVGHAASYWVNSFLFGKQLYTMSSPQCSGHACYWFVLDPVVHLGIASQIYPLSLSAFQLSLSARNTMPSSVSWLSCWPCMSSDWQSKHLLVFHPVLSSSFIFQHLSGLSAEGSTYRAWSLCEDASCQTASSNSLAIGCCRYGETLIPDVWFDAKAVWEVKAADLSVSPVHCAALGLVDASKGVSIRFPRLVC